MNNPDKNVNSLSEALNRSDDNIIDQIIYGEHYLFEVIMRRYNQRLYRVLRTILKSDDEAEEILQSTYVTVFFKLKEYNKEGKFAGWITKIATHLAFAAQRKKIRELPIDQESSEDIFNPSRLTQEQEVNSKELRTIINNAIEQLTLENRTIFILREIEQLSIAETADCTQISEANVKVRLHRAKGQLQQIISETLKDELQTIFEFGNTRCDQLVSSVFSMIEMRLTNLKSA